jgi:hypothetical protein
MNATINGAANPDNVGLRMKKQQEQHSPTVRMNSRGPSFMSPSPPEPGGQPEEGTGQ